MQNRPTSDSQAAEMRIHRKGHQHEKDLKLLKPKLPRASKSSKSLGVRQTRTCMQEGLSCPFYSCMVLQTSKG